MPRFYWVTFVLSVAIGILTREYMLTHDLGVFKFMGAFLIVIFINEKTSTGENLLRRHMTIMILSILAVVTYALWSVGL